MPQDWNCLSLWTNEEPELGTLHSCYVRGCVQARGWVCRNNLTNISHFTKPEDSKVFLTSCCVLNSFLSCEARPGIKTSFIHWFLPTPCRMQGPGGWAAGRRGTGHQDPRHLAEVTAPPALLSQGRRGGQLPAQLCPLPESHPAPRLGSSAQPRGKAHCCLASRPASANSSTAEMRR